MFEFEDEISEFDEVNEVEEYSDEEVYSIIRDVLDQNVETQHLPSLEKFEVEGDERNGIYSLKDEANFKLYDKDLGEYVEVSGEELNQLFEDKYGTTTVEYRNGEPDFSEFETIICIDDCETNGYGHLDKTKDSIERYGENGTIDEVYELIASELNCDASDVEKYIHEHDLVVHEEGFDEFRIIPSDVHHIFKHTGSIGIKKDLDALATSIDEVVEHNDFTLVKEDKEGEVFDLDEAIAQAKTRNKEIKRNI